VLCTICDLTICSENAILGQVGPKMGSVDPGYGTAFLARVVGEKRAREIWHLPRLQCRDVVVTVDFGGSKPGYDRAHIPLRELQPHGPDDLGVNSPTIVPPEKLSAPRYAADSARQPIYSFRTRYRSHSAPPSRS